MNLGELKDEVIRRVNQSIGGNLAFADQEVTDAINNGYLEMSDTSEFYEVNETLTTTGELYEDLFNPVLLSHPLLTLRHIFNPTNNLWLEADNFRKFDQSFSRWETIYSVSIKFIWRGLSYLGFYPRQVSGSTYQIYYTALPNALTILSDTPLMPQEFHLGLACYAAFELLSRRNEPKKAMIQWEQYKAYEVKLIQFVRERQKLDRAPGFGRPSTSRTVYEVKPI